MKSKKWKFSQFTLSLWHRRTPPLSILCTHAPTCSTNQQHGSFEKCSCQQSSPVRGRNASQVSRAFSARLGGYGGVCQWWSATNEVRTGSGERAGFGDKWFWGQVVHWELGLWDWSLWDLVLVLRSGSSRTSSVRLVQVRKGSNENWFIENYIGMWTSFWFSLVHWELVLMRTGSVVVKKRAGMNDDRQNTILRS